MAAARTYIEIECSKMANLPIKKQLTLISIHLQSDKQLEETIVTYRVLYQKFCKKLDYEIKYNWQWMMIEVAVYNLLMRKNGRCSRK